MSFSDHSAVDIAADPISEVESFLQLFPFLFEQRASPWTPDTLADSHRLQCTLVRSIGGPEMQHLENPITGFHDGGLPVTWSSASGSMYRTTYPSSSTSTLLLETEAPDSSISNASQINLVDEDTDCNLNQSPTPIPQDIPSKPTSGQYIYEIASRNGAKKLQKSGNILDKVSSQLSRPLAGTGGALSNGPYMCDICGKRYAQPQGVGRHYRGKHGNPNPCKYYDCDFKWSRPYVYEAHRKTKHRDAVFNAAQDDATRTSYRVENTAHSPQQHPVLTLTPEHDQRLGGGAETWSTPLTPPPPVAVDVAPARSPAIHRVDRNPQLLGSAEPTKRRKRKREHDPESQLRTELLATEGHAQVAKDLDMPVRMVQATCPRFQEGSPRQGGYSGNLVIGAPTDESCGTRFSPSCFPTHWYYDGIRKRAHLSVGEERKPTYETLQALSGILNQAGINGA